MKKKSGVVYKGGRILVKIVKKWQYGARKIFTVTSRLEEGSLRRLQREAVPSGEDQMLIRARRWE